MCRSCNSIKGNTMNIIQSPSPNFYSRQEHAPSLLVIHVTDGYFPGDLDYLRNPAPLGGVGLVSSHDLIAPNGDVHELVDWQNGAWHAGRVLNPTAKLLKKNWFGNYINPNFYSYGIEVSCKPPAVPTPAQFESLRQRIKDRLALFGLPTDRDHVIGHKEIYSGKTCPGPINLELLVQELIAPPPSQPSHKLTESDKISILEKIKIVLDQY